MGSVDSARRLLEGSRRVLISGHLRADGDCLGAQSVLYHLCRALGKEAEVLLPDDPDGRYDFLHVHTPYRTLAELEGEGEEIPEHDLVFVCDCSTLDRLGRLGEILRARPEPIILVDHHPLRPEDEASFQAFVHSVEAPASGLLAWNFARSFGVELPPAAHEAAFTALATDTGWFRYSNAGLGAWEAATAMVAAGVQPDRVFGLIYQRCDRRRPAGIAASLQHLEYHLEGRLALAWVGQEDLRRAGGSLEDTDEVLDILRSVAGVEAVAFLHERAPGEVKASLRSQGGVDVSRVARALGGGGHARAAGVTFEPGTTLLQAVDRVRSALVEAVATAAAG